MKGFSLQDLLDQIGDTPPRRKPNPPRSATAKDIKSEIRMGTIGSSMPQLSGMVPVPAYPSPPLRDDSKRTLVSGLLAALGQVVTAREPNSLGSALGRFAGQLATNQAAQQYTNNIGTGLPDPVSSKLLSPEQLQSIRTEHENTLYKQAVMAQMMASSERKDAEAGRSTSGRELRSRLGEVILPTDPEGKSYPNGFRYYMDKDTGIKTPIGPVVKPPIPTSNVPSKKQSTRMVGSGMTATIQGLLAQEFLPEAKKVIESSGVGDAAQQLDALKDPLTRSYKPDAIFALLPHDAQKRWMKGQAEYAAAYQKSGEILSTQAKRMGGTDSSESPEVTAISKILSKSGVPVEKDNIAAAMLIQTLNKATNNTVEVTQENIDRVWSNPNLQSELRKILRSLK